MTRITSPAATQSMSSPGWIWYSSAILLGTVTWYLDVTLAIGASKLYPYYSKDQILVPNARQRLTARAFNDCGFPQLGELTARNGGPGAGGVEL
jgi:hypothetical protein